MIKTLRITSVLVAMGAIALLGISVVYGIDKDSEVQALVASNGPVAQFEKNLGRTAAAKNVNTKHPLVLAAEGFARLLNPPKPQPRVVPKRSTPGKIKPSVSQNLSGNTKLVGTCYNADDPSLSFALVDVPGKGQRWVSVNDKIDHHVIGEILDGKVILHNGAKRQTLVVEKKATMSLIKGENKGVTRTATVRPVNAAARPSKTTPTRSSLPRRPVLRPQTRTAPLRALNPVTPEERERMLDRVMAEAQEMQVDVPGMSEEERETERLRREKVMAAILAARKQGAQNTGTDTNQLRDLGKEFLDKQTKSDGN